MFTIALRVYHNILIAGSLISRSLCQAALKKKNTKASGRFSVIIFSKDRPLQLTALLQSMNHFVKGSANVHVLYNCSNREYEIAYANVQKQFSKATFTRESVFRDDLLRLLKNIQTYWLFFLVDDIIFTDEVNLGNLLETVPSASIVSLRLHPGITYSYMTGKEQAPPVLRKISDDLLTFEWHKGGIDWSYPLSVDGHIFETVEIVRLINRCTFKAPNSLEAALQKYSKLMGRLKIGVCFRVPKIVNFPLNRVQNEFANLAGEVSTEKLLQLYNDGYELDYLHFAHSSFNSVHVEVELKLKQP